MQYCVRLYTDIKLILTALRGEYVHDDENDSLEAKPGSDEQTYLLPITYGCRLLPSTQCV